MNLLFISGSLPPVRCGVGDYSYNLLKLLQENSYIKKLIFVHSSENLPGDLQGKKLFIKKWNFKSLFKIINLIRKENISVLHIQYPSISYNHSIIPQLLVCILYFLKRKFNKLKIIVTIHEYSQTHFLRKLSIIPFFIFSDFLIFTNDFEKEYARKFFINLSKKSYIINIGSNINVHYDIRPEKKVQNYIIFFGLIRPSKGLENFIKLVEISSYNKLNYKFAIIGTPQLKTVNYYKSLLKKTSHLPVDWKIDLSEKEVSYQLSLAKYAYLVFPDGPSERRTSLLACLSHKILILSSKGIQTPDYMEDFIIFVNSPEDALNKIEYLNNNYDKYIEFVKRYEKYINKFSWTEIIKKHILIYNKLVNL